MMHLKRYITVIVTLLTFILFVNCETSIENPTNNQDYNSPLKINSNKKIKDDPLNNQLDNRMNEGDTKFLKVGLMTPLSGENYLIGRSILNAAQLAIEKTNQKFISISIIDTGNENELTRNLYNALQDNIDIFVGPVFTKNVKRVSKILDNKNIPLITLSNNSRLEDEGVYVFGLTLEDEINQLLNYSHKNNLNKYAVIIPKNEYGERVKVEIEKFNAGNKLVSFKYIFYDTAAPDFYSISKSISNYEERKLNLENKINSLKEINTDQARNELKQLKRRDTYGELDFQAILVLTQNFRELSSLSSILPYYDVDPKKIQYMGNSVWSNKLSLKEPGLINGYFTSLNINSRKTFEQDYKNIFNSNSNFLSGLTYDIFGLISRLHSKNNKFSETQLHSELGFVGIDGWFRVEKSGKVSRKLNIYKIKNQEFILLN